MTPKVIQSPRRFGHATVSIALLCVCFLMAACNVPSVYTGGSTAAAPAVVPSEAHRERVCEAIVNLGGELGTLILLREHVVASSKPCPDNITFADLAFRYGITGKYVLENLELLWALGDEYAGSLPEDCTDDHLLRAFLVSYRQHSAESWPHLLQAIQDYCTTSGDSELFVCSMMYVPSECRQSALGWLEEQRLNPTVTSMDGAAGGCYELISAYLREELRDPIATP